MPNSFILLNNGHLNIINNLNTKSTIRQITPFISGSNSYINADILNDCDANNSTWGLYNGFIHSLPNPSA